MPVAGEELFHGLRESELHIEEPAVAKDHHEKAQPPSSRADRNRTKLAPVRLRTLRGGKFQHEKSGLGLRTNLMDEILDGGVAAGKALFSDSLKDLLRGI